MRWREMGKMEWWAEKKGERAGSVSEEESRSSRRRKGMRMKWPAEGLLRI